MAAPTTTTYSETLKAIAAQYEEALRKVHTSVKEKHKDISENEQLPLILQSIEKVLGLAATSIDERQISQSNSSQQINADNKQELDENGQPKKKKPVRVYLDGCFDIMHSGHYNAVRQAKMLGDVLVAGVHSDTEITFHKGPPVMNNEERVGLVKACKWVDEVAFDTPYNPTIELLDKLNCDFVVHGDDIPSTADGQEAYADVRRAGRMKIIKRTPGVSTTDLVGRLLLMTKDHHSSPAPITLSSPRLGPAPLALDEPQSSSTSSSTNAPEKKQKTEPKGDSAWKNVTHAEEHYTAGLSSFLPTTWRITQFANNKTPKPDDVVVYIDGAFDLFHIGHVETLRKAKELGTFLYVGIHDDKTVNQHKGRNYPIMNLHERVLNVLACKHVDEVVIGAPWVVTKDLLKVLNIQIVVTGSNSKLDPDTESSVAGTNDPYKVAKEMGIFKVVDTTHQLQTQDVINRIIENRLKYEKRNASREKKELAYLEKREYVAEI